MISRAVHVTVLIIITGHKFYNRHLNHKKLFLKKKLISYIIMYAHTNCFYTIHIKICIG